MRSRGSSWIGPRRRAGTPAPSRRALILAALALMLAVRAPVGPGVLSWATSRRAPRRPARPRSVCRAGRASRARSGRPAGTPAPSTPASSAGARPGRAAGRRAPVRPASAAIAASTVAAGRGAACRTSLCGSMRFRNRRGSSATVELQRLGGRGLGRVVAAVEPVQDGQPGQGEEDHRRVVARRRADVERPLVRRLGARRGRPSWSSTQPRRASERAGEPARARATRWSRSPPPASLIAAG